MVWEVERYFWWRMFMCIRWRVVMCIRIVGLVQMVKVVLPNLILAVVISWVCLASSLSSCRLVTDVL